MESFDVEQLSANEWTISLTPGNCGYGLPLLGVHRGLSILSQEDTSTYGFSGVQSRVTIQRIQATTPPVRGNFSVSYQGRTIPGTVSNCEWKTISQN